MVSDVFVFLPDPWGDDPIWYFSDGWLNHQLVFFSTAALLFFNSQLEEQNPWFLKHQPVMIELAEAATNVQNLQPFVTGSHETGKKRQSEKSLLSPRKFILRLEGIEGKMPLEKFTFHFSGEPAINFDSFIFLPHVATLYCFKCSTCPPPKTWAIIRPYDQDFLHNYWFSLWAGY